MEPAETGRVGSNAVANCGHYLCLFEHDCLVAQDEAELHAARFDAISRSLKAQGLAAALGLGQDAAGVLDVALYGRNLRDRIAACDVLVEELQQVALDRRAA